MFSKLAVFIALAAAFAHAAPSPTTTDAEEVAPRAASCSFPSPPKTSSLSAAMSITGTFDGGNVRFDRGSGACKGQTEGGDKDAVFILQSGATLQNVVIGANQAEGVHCLGPCTLRNVWFEDVCEDAITIKQSSGTSTITGGGAKNADDKVVQHNGGGNVVIDSYCVQNFGKLYRSCGNCSSQTKRTVSISNISASGGGVIAGVNSNYGDVATIKSVSGSYDSLCDTYQGNSNGDEPEKLTSNQKNANCVF
ncbi:polysaccharide lyase family 3 protein [Marasmius fiardii PR-910]|nr:polysaccharide lyase family 3 protein [Marasmius fiardii PR-910]